jgi:hypothetical protein
MLGDNISRLGGLSCVWAPLLPHELSNRILNSVASAGENALLNLSANPTQHVPVNSDRYNAFRQPKPHK